MVHYRTLGKTGFQVSEIGYGTWGIGKGGWTGAEDDESLRALNAAIDRGLIFIDTALAYRNGHSESLIGQVVRARSERVYVATKVPPKNGQWSARPGVQRGGGIRPPTAPPRPVDRHPVAHAPLR